MAAITAKAFANIALIKYWGNQDDSLRIPSNGSISMNLAGLFAQTTVEFDPLLQVDTLTLNDISTTGPALTRVQAFLDQIRWMAGKHLFARVTSSNNFASGAGIASSAAAFAALALAASKAIGLELTESDLSRLARRGSGSACRSVPAGFVEWFPGTSDEDSYAESIATPSHWGLVDCIAVVSSVPKLVGSTEGHQLANTSPLQAARLADAPRRLELCRKAIRSRDFELLALVAEQDSNLMHAVMQTSIPALLYWEPATLQVMLKVKELRKQNIPVFYTVDAGPNVHVITLSAYQNEVEAQLSSIQSVKQVLSAGVGYGAALVNPR